MVDWIPFAAYILPFAGIGVLFLRCIGIRFRRRISQRWLARSAWLFSLLFATASLALTAWALLALLRSWPPAPVDIAISSPQAESVIHSPKLRVAGSVSPSHAVVRLLVHPEDTDIWYVQSPPIVDKKVGQWRGFCYLGTESMGIGVRYDVIAVASTGSWFVDTLLGRRLEPEQRVKVLPLLNKSRIVVVERAR